MHLKVQKGRKLVEAWFEIYNHAVVVDLTPGSSAWERNIVAVLQLSFACMRMETAYTFYSCCCCFYLFQVTNWSCKLASNFKLESLKIYCGLKVLLSLSSLDAVTLNWIWEYVNSKANGPRRCFTFCPTLFGSFLKDPNKNLAGVERRYIEACILLHYGYFSML